MTPGEFIKAGENAQKATAKEIKAGVGYLEKVRDYCYQQQHEKYMAEADNLIQYINDMPEGK